MPSLWATLRPPKFPQTYYISKGEIRPADARFSPKNQYELRLTQQSEVQEAPEGGPAIQRMKFTLLPSLGDIEQCPVNTNVGLLRCLPCNPSALLMH